MNLDDAALENSGCFAFANSKPHQKLHWCINAEVVYVIDKEDRRFILEREQIKEGEEKRTM